MKEMVLKINGMHCGGCETRVKNSLSEIDGVENVVANHNDGIVKITLNKDIDNTVLKDAIEDIGFEAIGD